MNCRWRCGLALVIGAIAGAMLPIAYYRHRLEAAPPQWLYVYYTGQVVKDVDALIQLRRSETGPVITDLEEDLSAQLYDLSQHFRADALSKEKDVRILKAAASYRAEHPFNSGNTEKDRAVDELLMQARSK